MKKLTPTGHVVVAVDPDEIRLDLQLKKVLACKPILARILQGTMEECRNMTPDEVEACIEGEVQIMEVPVEPGLPEMITGQSQEDFQQGEGLVRYDIRTFIRLPSSEAPELVKILVDVEAQKDDHPGYDLPLRALFYCCRMISAQLNTEFSNSSDDPVKYGNIKKVYSIWICTEAAKKRANSIEQYKIRREMLCGTNSDDPRYDLMAAVIVSISKDHDTRGSDNGLICMLTDLLNDNMEIQEKLRLLEEVHGIPMTVETRQEVTEMSGYAARIKREATEKGLAEGRAKGQEEGRVKGLAEGRAEGRLDAIRNMIELGLSKEQILTKYSSQEYEKAEQSMLAEV